MPTILNFQYPVFKFQIVLQISFFFQICLNPDPKKVYALQLVDLSFETFSLSLLPSLSPSVIFPLCPSTFICWRNLMIELSRIFPYNSSCSSVSFTLSDYRFIRFSVFSFFLFNQDHFICDYVSRDTKYLIIFLFFWN